MYDLVSYQSKHNENNKEDNRDGINDSIPSRPSLPLFLPFPLGHHPVFFLFSNLKKIFSSRHQNKWNTYLFLSPLPLRLPTLSSPSPHPPSPLSLPLLSSSLLPLFPLSLPLLSPSSSLLSPPSSLPLPLLSLFSPSRSPLSSSSLVSLNFCLFLNLRKMFRGTAELKEKLRTTK